MKHLNKTEQHAITEFKETLLKELGSNLQSIRIFGSKVRGDFHKESDIDVFIVVNRNDRKTSDVINSASYEMMLKRRVLISPIVYTRKKYIRFENKPTSFIYNILKDGILV